MQDRTPVRAEDDEIDLRELLRPMWPRWRLLLASVAVAGALGAAASFLFTPMFSSTSVFIPPQQQQSSAASALASLGALGSLVGAAGAVKSSADEYVSLMQSTTVSDRLIDQFKLMSVYDVKFRQDARKDLLRHASITIGKKDGLITVVVDDESPVRAAAIANQYVEELRRMTSLLAVSEAQQRRVFFEKQTQDAKTHLIAAQTALQQSGFADSVLKTEPRAAADQYARLRAQETAAEVRLQTLRTSLADTSPQVEQQLGQLTALQEQLDKLAAATASDKNAPDYISKYREFKYQETLFELMAKQYELARVDESREGGLVQVVDRALPAERKSRPRRAFFAVGGALFGLLACAAWIHVRSRRVRPA
jgi:uncharacterized protein involved in exopolysaccharide biosynthesis